MHRLNLAAKKQRKRAVFIEDLASTMQDHVCHTNLLYDLSSHKLPVARASGLHAVIRRSQVRLLSGVLGTFLPSRLCH